MMDIEKFITVEIPNRDENSKNISWWVPSNISKVIKIIEIENPYYNFHQIVTSPNGRYGEFAIMKAKKKYRKNKDFLIL